MNDLEQLLGELHERLPAAQERFEQLNWDECQLCGAAGEDKRSLYLSMFYALEEVVPEAIDLNAVHREGSGYFLRLCKDCRARLLGHLRVWAGECREKRGAVMDTDGHLELPEDPDRNIPIRQDGALRNLTRAEWDERQKEKPS